MLSRSIGLVVWTMAFDWRSAVGDFRGLGNKYMEISALTRRQEKSQDRKSWVDYRYVNYGAIAQYNSWTHYSQS